MSDLASLLEESPPAETFVRRALGLLESDFRTMALLALADWDALGRPAPELARAIGGLTRPSWGAWNGLVAALRNARRTALREGDAPARERLGQARALRALAALLDERVEPETARALEPLAAITGTSTRRLRLGAVLAMPIALRNRVVHDSPTEPAWWTEAADALRPLLALHAERRPCLLVDERPAPWFVRDEDGTEWTFAGLSRAFDASYVSPTGQTREDAARGAEALRAFSRILGREQTQSRDFEALLRKLAPEEIRGVLMGDYLVGRPVGRGGFAQVHLARQLSTGRRVALKVLHDGLDEDARARFGQEAAFLSQLRHPGIVGVVGFGEETWRRPRGVDLSDEAWLADFERSAPVKTYLALDWIDGRTLEQVFAEGSPDPRTLAGWLAQAAAALEVVHAQGLIHRDVKPGNLMVDAEGHLTLMDFGIARSQDETRTLHTQTGTALGTPAYMSPEQIRALDGEAEVGPASDVYGLGATFYELFTGRRIFDHPEAGLRGVETRKLAGELPTRPRAIRPELPWELEAILVGCLQPEVGDRYRSMGAVLGDVQRYLADEPITWRRPSLPRRVRLGYRRHRTIANLVGAFVFLAVWGVALYVRAVQEGRQLAEEKQAEAERQAELAERRAGIAREALGSLVHEVRNELDDIPGPRARAARARLLGVALGGFESLRDAEVLDAPFSVDAAEAHRQVADLALETRGVAEAIPALESALAVSRALHAANPDHPAALRDLVYSLRSLARVLDDAGELPRARALLEEALAAGERWVTAAPGDDLARRDLAALQSSFGQTLVRQGELTAASRSFAQSLAALEALKADGADLTTLERDIAVVSTQLGEVRYVTGDLDGATELFAAAVAAHEARLAAEPAGDPAPSVVKDVAMSLDRLARITAVRGDLPAARRHYERERALAAGLVERDPLSLDHRGTLAQAVRRIGELDEDQGRLGDALARFREALAIFDRIVAEDPGNSFMALQRTVALDGIGRVLELQGDLAGALAAYREGVPVRRAAVEADPRDAMMRRGLSQSLRRIGSILEDQGDLEAAERGMQQSVQELRAVLAVEPEDDDARHELAGALRLLGRVQKRRGKSEEAAAAVEEAIAIMRGLVGEDAGRDRDRTSELVIALQDAADVLGGREGGAARSVERLSESVELADRLLAADPTDVEAARMAATARARIAEAHERAGRLDAARAAAAEALARFRARAEAMPDNVVARTDLAEGLFLTARLHEAAGDVAAAFEAAREGVERAAALGEIDPSDLGPPDLLAGGLGRLGGLAVQLGRADEALAAFERMVAVRRDLLERAPSPGARRDLARALDRTGFLLAELERTEQARPLLEEALALARRGVEDAPGDPDALRGLSVTLNQVGHLRRVSGDAAGARELLAQSAKVSRELAALAPADARARRDLAVALIKLGEALFAEEKVEEALAVYEEAGTIVGPLAEADPTNAMAQRDRAVVAGKVTDVYWSTGRLDEALEAARQTLAAMKALHELDPASAQARRDHAISHVKVGYVLKDRGDLPGAVAALREAVAIYRPIVESPGAPAAARGEFARLEETLAELDRRRALAAGESPAESPVDSLKAAYALMRTRAFAKATAAFEKAFAGDPRIKGDLQNGHLYRAATIASLASAEDAKDEADAERLRALALGWIAEDLENRRAVIARVDAALAEGPEPEREEALRNLKAQLLEHIEIARVKDGDLAAVRAMPAFAELFDAAEDGGGD